MTSRRRFFGGLLGLGALPFIGRGEQAAPAREPQADDVKFQPQAAWPEAPPEPAPKPGSLLAEFAANSAPTTLMSWPSEVRDAPFYVTRVNGYMVPVCQFNDRGQVQFGPISFHELDVKELRTGPYENPETHIYSSVFYKEGDPTRCVEENLASTEKIYYMWSRKFRRWMTVTLDVFNQTGNYDGLLARINEANDAKRQA